MYRNAASKLSKLFVLYVRTVNNFAITLIVDIIAFLNFKLILIWELNLRKVKETQIQKFNWKTSAPAASLKG